jgi:hypothetical protein
LQRIQLLEAAAHLYFRRDTDWLEEDGNSVSVFCVLADFPEKAGPDEATYLGKMDWLARAQQVYRATTPTSDVLFVD